MEAAELGLNSKLVTVAPPGHWWAGGWRLLHFPSHPSDAWCWRLTSQTLISLSAPPVTSWPFGWKSTARGCTSRLAAAWARAAGVRQARTGGRPPQHPAPLHSSCPAARGCSFRPLINCKRPLTAVHGLFGVPDDLQGLGPHVGWSRPLAALPTSVIGRLGVQHTAGWARARLLLKRFKCAVLHGPCQPVQRPPCLINHNNSLTRSR